jgi:serine/threonine protein kinase
MHHQDSASPDPNPERLVAGRYRLLSALGEGGMGTVWRARDEVLHREVAVKEVRAPAGLPAAKVALMYTRLEREAWAAARITARNVVTIHDVVTDGGRPWIVMELVRGQSLADLLTSQGALVPREAARIGTEVLAALRAAHDAGVLHRDVKPANVLLSDDGRVVLTDFGIAMVEGDTALTMTGEVVGSPEYLAPERALGRTTGPASDLWSLGVLLYTAVQGRSPFRQDNALTTLRAVVDDEPPAPHRAGPLAPVIEGLLRKDPAERVSAQQTAQDLRLIAAGDTPDADTTPATTVSAPASADTTAAITIDAPTAPLQPSPSNDTATITVDTPTAPPHPATPLAPPQAPPTRSASTVADEAPASTRPRLSRRTGYVLAAVAAVSALLLVGLGDALKGSGGDGRADAKAHAAAVTVSVTGTNTTYAGDCPPSQAQAPTFTASFSVAELPAQFSYRWVSAEGAVVDPQWRRLSFPEGGPHTHQETVRLTTYSQAGTLSSAMGVEIRSPLQAVSNAVSFSLSCGVPPDGTSSAP